MVLFESIESDQTGTMNYFANVFVVYVYKCYEIIITGNITSNINYRSLIKYIAK